MSPFRFLVVVVAVLSVGLSSCVKKQANTPVDSPLMQKALAMFFENRVDSANALFREVVEKEPGNARAMAFLASSFKYLNKPEDARAMAMRAIRTDTAQAMACTVLADLYYPQYGYLSETSYDSTRFYIAKALAADSTITEAWLLLWAESYRNNDPALEASCMRHLYAGGFFTPAMLDYTRALLQSLPRNTVYVSGGDMDTYPAIALQIVENLRPDVCVANVNMLNLPGYVSVLTQRFKLPAVMSEEAIRDFAPYRENGDEPVFVAHKILAAWCEAAIVDPAARPVVFSIMADEKELLRASGAEYGFGSAGPVYYLRARDTDPRVYAAPVGAFLDALHMDALTGPPASEVDLSPLRRGAPRNMLTLNVMTMALQLAWHLATAGERDEAGTRLEWCRELSKRASFDPADASGLRDAMARIEERIGK